MLTFTNVVQFQSKCETFSTCRFHLPNPISPGIFHLAEPVVAPENKLFANARPRHKKDVAAIATANQNGSVSTDSVKSSHLWKKTNKDQRILVFVCVVITLFLERVLLLNALRHPPLTYATFMEARRLSSYSPTHSSVEDCPQVGYAPISDVYSSQRRAPDGDWTAGGAKVLPSLFIQSTYRKTAIS